MSRALPENKRRTDDAYMTPDPLALALVHLLPIGPGDIAWEPHAGGGAFVRALASRGATVVASDITLREWPEAQCSAAVDFLHTTPTFRPGPMPTWIVGNPPFRKHEAHVDHALSMAPNVAFLLRLAVMESAARAPMWARWPLRRVTVLARRPSFTSGGTDAAAYGFFWWQRGYTGTAEIVPGWMAPE